MADFLKKMDAPIEKLLPLLKKGKWEKGVRACTKILELAEKDGTAPAALKEQIHFIRGTCHAQMKAHKCAVSDFSKSLELDPENADYYHSRGLAYHKMGEFDHAIKDFTKSLDLNPEDALAYRNRGMAHIEKRECYHAIADFSKFLKIRPADFVALTARGCAYAYMEDYSRAFSDFDTVLKKDPKNELALAGKAFAAILQQLTTVVQKKDRKHDQKQVAEQKEETGAEIKHQASQFLRHDMHDARYKEFQDETKKAGRKIRNDFIILKVSALILFMLVLAGVISEAWNSKDSIVPLIYASIFAASVCATPFIAGIWYQQRNESRLMALTQDAHTKSVLTDMNIDPATQKELLLKNFTNSSHLIVDLEKHAKPGFDSAKIVAQLLSKLGG